MTLKSPFPYFGGKSKIAPQVWQRFGNTPNYVEPFFGSGAVILARPADHLKQPRIETVNDKDGMVSNFWRAVVADADAVARYADYPANENDLHARHAWLVAQRDDLTRNLEGDPNFYDPKVAGWWVWGMALWIGSGFCSGRGAWRVVDGKLVRSDNADKRGVFLETPRLSADQGIRRASLADDSAGIARQLPALSSGGQGIQRKLIHTADAGRGVQRQLLHMGGERRVRRTSNADLYAYFEALQTRLKRVRVCSGDWTRVMGESVTTGNGLTAVLLDPPYTHDGRETGVYTHDDADIAAAARQWALDNGDNPLLRIAYCGYDDDGTFPPEWERLNWSAHGGYDGQRKHGTNTNKHRETVFFSPHCLKPETARQIDLFTWETTK